MSSADEISESVKTESVKIGESMMQELMEGLSPDWRRGPWRESAACKGADIDLFFPPSNEGWLEKRVYPQRNGEAIREYCDNCPVKIECLLTAIEECEMFGIWGGMSGYNRKQYAKRHKIGMYAEKIQEQDLDEQPTLVPVRVPVRVPVKDQ